ncbi:DoxX family protein [Chryseobacterium sp. IHB B 17019]|uniref:DoxX family protein n=1 Tax=Chryseobacterium sp. IHB B 17019 TaxID=1721091 RepID=UPI0007201847|nr:DoxX family protein [Chryseobacterium sp. IHB B 17019]ALR30399.1 DoxX family protein [Chryseobacterium sp. IHB B 17019]
MINSIIQTKPFPLFILRLIVGLIFLSEGLQKFITPESVGAGRFAKIGFQNPEFWASLVGSVEIVCGILLLLGFISRLAAIPLLIIMIVAFVTTKIPTLSDKGFWVFAHEYRTDFSMTMLLIFLLYFGSGNFSIDKNLISREQK